MTELDYLREDTVDFGLFCEVMPPAEGGNPFATVLRVLEDEAGDLKPDQIADRRVANLTPNSVRRVLEAQAGRSTMTLHAIRTAPVEIAWELNAAAGKPVPFWIRCIIPMQYFTGPLALERSRRFVTLVHRLADDLPPLYGYAHSKGDFSLGSDPHRRDASAEFRVYEVYWLNVYGPGMIRAIGRDHLVAIPAYEKHWLRNGGVLFGTSPTPADFASTDSRRVQARILAALRPGTDAAAALEQLLRRSGALSPAEPQWDPDVADLFALVVDDYSYAERANVIRGLNSRAVPPVAEQRAVGDATPSAIDPPRVVEEYETHAEKFIALIHQYIPEIADGLDPSLLPRIDHHFYRYDYPSTFSPSDIERELLPAVGSFLGKMLVDQLGGRWAPQQDRLQTAVVIGETAWLPFLRAQHFLQSAESVLDHSLTQLYRTAARAAREAARR